MTEFRLDRTKVAIFTLGNEPKGYIYWLTQTAEKRLSAIEFYRQQYCQNYATESRLQRVYQIVKRQDLADTEN